MMVYLTPWSHPSLFTPPCITRASGVRPKSGGQAHDQQRPARDGVRQARHEQPVDHQRVGPLREQRRDGQHDGGHEGKPAGHLASRHDLGKVGAAVSLSPQGETLTLTFAAPFMLVTPDFVLNAIFSSILLCSHSSRSTLLLLLPPS